ncbi:VWA domain-containing protein [Candidatus Woesearchaeota archaeon]|nr:VWA domain-containing protein [Candidatus Woesearchaeota archaeon]
MIFPSSKRSNKRAMNYEKGEQIQSQSGTGKQKIVSSAHESKEDIEKGKLVNSMVNYGFGFTPDITFENIIRDYRFAEKLYGKTFLKEITGYDSGYIKRNLSLPEFRRKLKQMLREKFESLRKDKVIDSSGQVTDTGIKLGSVVLYIEELNNLITKGTGDKRYKIDKIGSEPDEIIKYEKGKPYRDIALRASINLAIKRGHGKIQLADLKAHSKKSKGRINVIYAFDTSGSMRGNKIEMAKKAGIALIFNALNNQDKVGLILFESKVTEKIAPSSDFMFLLNQLVRAKALKQTNVTSAITTSIDLFPRTRTSKHLIMITDALPTIGKEPEEDTLNAAAIANDYGITISIVGINLNKQGMDLAKRIVELGKGRLYIVKNIEELDKVVLQDYYSLI